jgi:hypothetical protein
VKKDRSIFSSEREGRIVREIDGGLGPGALVHSAHAGAARQQRAVRGAAQHAHQRRRHLRPRAPLLRILRHPHDRRGRFLSTRQLDILCIGVTVLSVLLERRLIVLEFVHLFLLAALVPVQGESQTFFCTPVVIEVFESSRTNQVESKLAQRGSLQQRLQMGPTTARKKVCVTPIASPTAARERAGGGVGGCCLTY